MSSQFYRNRNIQEMVTHAQAVDTRPLFSPPTRLGNEANVLAESTFQWHRKQIVSVEVISCRPLVVAVIIAILYSWLHGNVQDVEVFLSVQVFQLIFKLRRSVHMLSFSFSPCNEE